MRERWFSERLASILLFLHLALRFLAGLLINVTHGWRAAAGAALRDRDTLPSTSICPRSWAATSPAQKTCTWKHSSVSPLPPPGFFSLASLTLCYDLGLPSTCTDFPTSPAGNGSCLVTIILFSWWSALISLPQLILDPEAKGTRKWKQCRTTLGSSDIFN